MKGNRLLSKTFIKAQKREIEFTDKDKFIIFSDHHRGTNDWGDDFAHNPLDPRFFVIQPARKPMQAKPTAMAKPAANGKASFLNITVVSSVY